MVIGTPEIPKDRADSVSLAGGGIASGYFGRTSEEIHEPTLGDFEPAVRVSDVQQISRPSLSYWQDAWIRFRKNKRALVSLYVIGFLVVLTWAGHLVWPVDPSEQDLSHISVGPSFGDKALVVEDRGEWAAPAAEGVPPSPADAPADPAKLLAPAELGTVGIPSTQFVRLTWKPVAGASGYFVYRTDVKPNDSTELGLPLAEIEGGNTVGYEDSFDLRPGKFFYGVKAVYQGQESENVAQTEVAVTSAMAFSEAQAIHPGVKVGAEVRLATHPLGTDDLGRDLLARLIRGGQISLLIGFFAPLAYIFLGVIVGGIAGYYGGKIDAWVMRFTDLVIGLPFLLFMILFKIAFGIGPGESGVLPMAVSLVVLSWTGAARLTRGQVLQLRESEFVQAARLLGARPSYLILRHLVPNLMGVLIISLTFGIPSTIFTEAFLSFIGMGVVPPTPSWGSMCNDGIRSFLSHPHEFLFPAIIISITVLAFNMLGDGLRDALDPRMRSTE